MVIDNTFGTSWTTTAVLSSYSTVVIIVIIIIFITMVIIAIQNNDIAMTAGSTATGVAIAADASTTSANRYVCRRFRSLSASVDIDLSEQMIPGVDEADAATSAASNDQSSIASKASMMKSSWNRQQQRILAGGCDRYRTVSTNYIEQYRLLHHADCADLTMWKKKGMEMLRRVPEAFPFQSLPNDCRLIVFSFLSRSERGIAAQVCSNWAQLLRTPSLWNIVDFTNFTFCSRCSKRGRSCTALCYAAYKSRLKSFFRYLTSIRPTIHTLRAAFDVGDHRDGWLELIQGLLRVSQCKDLTHLYFNWKETPLKPLPWTTTTGDAFDIVYHHRLRQRLFLKLFDMVVAAAPNITQLTMPFDWSERSVRAVGRLRRLNSLTLTHYFWMQGVEPYLVEQLVSSASSLTQLSLEIYSASAYGLQCYQIKSQSLLHLDISASRGIVLSSVTLPRLKSLVVSRQPLNGPLVNESAGSHDPVPCLHRVLAEGAPSLQTLNGHRLSDNWYFNISLNNDEKLELILREVCSCNVHKPDIH